MKTKLDKCIHYGTCKNLSVTMCGKKWSESGCFIKVPITNSEYIRSLTDEELADWLECPEAECGDGSCTECVIRWLKKPYKGEHR